MHLSCKFILLYRREVIFTGVKLICIALSVFVLRPAGLSYKWSLCCGDFQQVLEGYLFQSQNLSHNILVVELLADSEDFTVQWVGLKGLPTDGLRGIPMGDALHIIRELHIFLGIFLDGFY